MISIKRKGSWIGLVLFILVVAAIYKFNPRVSSTSGIILYYGDGCPHCAKVEEFIKANNVEAKVKFERKEVFNHPDNSADMSVKYRLCEKGILKPTSMGVPFLYTGGRCYSGDQEIINYFAGRI